MTESPRLRVLLADDDQDQLMVRSLLLQSAGFAVTRASNCASALRLAASAKPHCAMLDLRLPTEELGLHLIRELKKLNAEIRLFVLTGADPGRFSHCPEATLVEEVFLKPASSSSLIERLKHLESQLSA